MADILIRFTGDASGLASFYSGVARQTDAFVGRLNKTYTSQFQKVISNPQVGTGLKTFPAKDQFGNFTAVGTDIKKLSYDFDQLNDVIKVTATTGFRLRNGKFLPVAETNTFHGSVKALNAELIKQDQILAARSQISQRLFAEHGALNERRNEAFGVSSNIQNQIDSSSAQAANLRAEREANNAAIRAQRAQIGKYGLTGQDEESVSAQERLNVLLQNRSNIQKALNLTTKELTTSQEAYNASLLDPRITEYPAQLKRIQLAAASARSALTLPLNASRAQEEKIKTAAPYAPPAGYQKLQQISPQLLSILGKGGLGSGTGTLEENLYKQGASFSAPIKDLERNLTEVSGAFQNSQGYVTRWSAQIDQNGKVITRFGGQLSGLSRIGQQISRDFQKVIEWTVATTVVFGGLAYAIQGLGIIKELDADLTRFSVTANLSAAQTKEFYGQIVQVAQITATPLDQLVKSADDLALAVRRPGESVQELTSDVLALATAVGVYTNLTGSDTVAATDQLVAIMKQLGLTAEDTFGTLTKITAVAGGQSGAISDITKGLAVMAEAGKEANLTVDQQIATIKVLSQVTSKSPAEIATAFKNLVGALENPAAVKALKSYNIGLISDGKSIIEIYQQIAEKIREGVIPQNNVSGLLRAISGGPRRAPDAAALLANIDTVQKETVVSTNATNEAFLANAKILDTLNAKFTIFQNTLKDKTFRQVGDVFKEIATVGISGLTTLLNIIGLIPSGLITLGIQVAALLLLFKGLSGILTKLGLDFLITGAAQQKFTQTTMLDAIAEKEAAIPLRQRLSTFAKGQGGRAALGSSLIGGGIGAAAAFAGGGGLPQILGSAAQGVGIGLLTVPSPEPWTKLAGGILLAAGTLASFIDSGSKAKETNDQLASSTLDAYTSYKQVADSLDTLSKNQSILKSEMTQTGISIQALGELQRQFVDNDIAMTQAQDDLNSSLKGLQNANPAFASLVQNVQDKLKPATALTEALRELQKTVLQTNFPNIALPSENGKSAFTGTAPVVNPGPDTRATVTNPLKNGPFGNQDLFDLKELEQDSNKVRILFTQNGDAINSSFVANSQNIERVREALAQLDDTKFREAALKSLDDWVATKNAVESAISAVNLYQAELQSSQPFFTPDDYKSIENGLNLLKQLIVLKNANRLSDDDFNALTKKYGDQIAEALNSGKGLSTSFFKDATVDLAKSRGLLTGVTEGSDQWRNIVNEVADKTFNIANLFGKIRGEISGVTDATEEFSKDLGKIIDDAQKSLAERSFNLHLQVTGGEKPTDSQEKIQAATKLVNDFSTSLNQGVSLGGKNFLDVIDSLKDKLAGVPGLENAASLTTQDFLSKLLDLTVNGKLTADQITQVDQALQDYLHTATVLGDVKASVPGITGTDKGTILKQLEGQKEALISGIKEGGPAELKVELVGIEQDIADVSALKDSLGGLPGLFTAASDASAEFTKTTQANIAELKQSLDSDLASKSANAYQQFLSGDINASQFKAAESGIRAMRGAVDTLTNALSRSVKEGGEPFTNELHAMAAGLQTIPGLEDASSLSADALIGRMLNMAETMGLSKKATDKLKDALINMFRVAQLITKYKAQFNLNMNITNLKQLRAALQAYKVLQIISTDERPGHNPGTGANIAAVNQALADLADIKDFSVKDISFKGSGIPTGSTPTSSDGRTRRTGGSGTAAQGPDVSTLDLPDEIANAANRNALIQEAIKRARALQSKIPGASKDAKNDIVELLKGTQRILEVRGVKDDYLRKALEELADVEKKRLEFETKADTIRRIQVGAGSFAAIANVPLNSKTGVSVGGPEGPITVNLNINGQVLTPAQFAALADQIAAAIKRQIAGG